MSAGASVARALQGDLVIVCGPGGVGKTTTAAALALAGSTRKKTLVCTIDPSKRLRTSLGLARLTGRPQRVRGSLFAMRLDPKATFDDLVIEHADSEAARDRILNNRIYQQISRHLAGTHEVMAMEALLGVAGDFELIVLDTPPASSALAFIDAPKRVLEFLDGRVLRYLLKPYFVAGRLALQPKTIVGKTLLAALDRTVGLDFLRDLSEFFLAFEGLFGSFRETATAMETKLRGPGTTFALVTTAASARLIEGEAFGAALEERGLRAGFMVVNRVHPWSLAMPDPTPPRAKSRLAPSVLAELRKIEAAERKHALADASRLAALSKSSRLDICVVPELEPDVHDLRSLGEVASWLHPGGGPARR